MSAQPPGPRASHPSFNGSGITVDVHMDHESRISQVEREVSSIAEKVGEVPFLDKPGSGISKLAADTYAATRITKWAVLIVATTLLGDRGLALARWIWPIAQAAPASSPKGTP